MASKQSDLRNILEEKAKLELKYRELTKIIQKQFKKKKKEKYFFHKKRKYLRKEHHKQLFKLEKETLKMNLIY